ncbi:MAG: nickel pincer cofactor biosynthesis protein LarC [Candidatus Omnitrophica bacterium]|nr:nickel pincer cofactor biosynthesis protein LarC [Candidatus Omnitrophota bacterium]
MKTIYIDAFAGLSGDLFLGALVDLGFQPESLERLPERLKLDGAKVTIKDVVRRGIASKQAIVEFPHEHVHRHLHHIKEILNQSDLPKEVTEGALKTFTCLAKAEAKVHGTTPDKIHFHEVGAVDAILDIVGTHLGFYELGTESIICSSIPLSRGQARMAHGVMPLPAPATVEILKGAPTRPIDVPFESVTPTGAALAVTLADSFGEWPSLRIERSGWGAATHEGGELPNLLRLVQGVCEGGMKQDRVWVLECEIDDMNPEFLEPLWTDAFKRGALDLYFTPVQMKKGRQGTLITLLAPETRRIECEQLLLESTTTFGVRRHLAERTILEREILEVETDFGIIPVKVAKGLPGKAAPEASAVKESAKTAGVPMSVVYNAALLAWAQRECGSQS